MSTQWAGCLDEADIGQELPIPLRYLESGVRLNPVLHFLGIKLNVFTFLRTFHAVIVRDSVILIYSQTTPTN